MASAWQTLEEAALTLGISSRTLHRRIARGEFETRLAHNRREVLVTIGDPTFNGKSTGGGGSGNLANAGANVPNRSGHLASDGADVSDGMSGVSVDRTSEFAGLSDVGFAAADMQNTMLTLHEDRIRRTDLAIMAYQQSVTATAHAARRAQLGARVAWGVTAAVTTMLFVAVVWATQRVTESRSQAEHLSTVVRQLSDTADAKAKQVETFRQEAEAARIASAKTEGQLIATRKQLDQSADTFRAQPASFITPAVTTRPSVLNAPAVRAFSFDDVTVQVQVDK
jgi:outer membrane murein-binding lipoprotein Lpp